MLELETPAASSSMLKHRVDIKSLVAEFEVARLTDVGWCSLEKATTLASIILALRPQVVVELGVWMGGSALPMAIALSAVGAGQLVAVDAWSVQASVLGQEADHLKWWGETMGEGGHEEAYQTFVKKLVKHSIPSERCRVVRQGTDEAAVPPIIDVLHHDANHGPQAVADIERWAPSVRVGGLLIIDDLDWPGGHVVRARDRALRMGFVEIYALDKGCVLQRVTEKSA